MKSNFTNKNLSNNSNKKFIAFFDILGFKNIIKNNNLDEVTRMFDILTTITDKAVTENQRIKIKPDLSVPNINYLGINCLFISDSIIFWTNSSNENDLNKILEISSKFYINSLFSSYFPLRGCLTFGEISGEPFNINNKNYTYNFNSIIGKGIVTAYEMAENLELSGCIIDDSIINLLSQEKKDTLVSERIICKYNVPTKNGKIDSFVFTPSRHIMYENVINIKKQSIDKLFTFASKADINNLSASVKLKIENTKEFISSFMKKQI